MRGILTVVNLLIICIGLKNTGLERGLVSQKDGGGGTYFTQVLLLNSLLALTIGLSKYPSIWLPSLSWCLGARFWSQTAPVERICQLMQVYSFEMLANNLKLDQMWKYANVAISWHLIFSNNTSSLLFTFGGLNGYVSGILISKTKLPPSYGVSGGPAISPRSSVKLSFFRSTFMWHLATWK